MTITASETQIEQKGDGYFNQVIDRLIFEMPKRKKGYTVVVFDRQKVLNLA